MKNESLSVIKVKDVLIVTVPQEPDDKVLSELQEKILNAIQKYSVNSLILDISLVNIVDSYFARCISDTSKMVNIMGGNTVIAGMRPSVAIICAQLGFKMGNVKMTLNMDYALDFLENNLKKKYR